MKKSGALRPILDCSNAYNEYISSESQIIYRLHRVIYPLFGKSIKECSQHKCVAVTDVEAAYDRVDHQLLFELLQNLVPQDRTFTVVKF